MPGERDERVEEVLADLQDVKVMYKDQIGRASLGLINLPA
jgi:hypothetical protein